MSVRYFLVLTLVLFFVFLAVSQMPVISNGATFNGFLLNAQQVSTEPHLSGHSIGRLHMHNVSHIYTVTLLDGYFSLEPVPKE